MFILAKKGNVQLSLLDQSKTYYLSFQNENAEEKERQLSWELSKIQQEVGESSDNNECPSS